MKWLACSAPAVKMELSAIVCARDSGDHFSEKARFATTPDFRRLAHVLPFEHISVTRPFQKEACHVSHPPHPASNRFFQTLGACPGAGLRPGARSWGASGPAARQADA